MTTDTKPSTVTDSHRITSPYFWSYSKNPKLSIVQVEPLSDIDEDLVFAYRKQNPQYRVVTVDKIPLLHLSNRYPRLSGSEYLRSLLSPDAVAGIQAAIELQQVGDSIPDSMTDRYKLAYGHITNNPQVESLLTLEECIDREILDCKLGATISITPGFLDTIAARLHNTLAPNFYASGDVTEAMAAQAIINYDLTPSYTMMKENHRKLCRILTKRIIPYLATDVPTLILLDSSLFNSFITGSCADRLIIEYGAFNNASEMSLSSTIDDIEAIYKSIGSDNNAMISLFARIWVIQSIIDVCDIDFARDKLEICKINIVSKLLGSYVSQPDTTDAIDLFSFYIATSRNPSVSLKKHSLIIKNIADIYRKVGYGDRADYVLRECEKLKLTSSPD
jgi:hypothetical protein